MPFFKRKSIPKTHLYNYKYIFYILNAFPILIYLSIQKIENNNSSDDQNKDEIIDNQLIQSNIYNLQSQKDIDLVQVDSSLESKDIEIVG